MGEANQLWIVTATNMKFWLSAKTLLDSLLGVDGVSGVLIFDLGLTGEAKAELMAASPVPCLIDNSLLSQLSHEYVSRYQFKVDGLYSAPERIRGSSFSPITSFFVLWLDSGVLINQSIARTRTLLHDKGYFLCDLTTRLAAGMPGTAIKAFNHLPVYSSDAGDFPFGIDTLTRPLLWAGIHGYRTDSEYQSEVVDAAYAITKSRPDMMSGPKFVDPEVRIHMESDPIFRAALDELMFSNVSVASCRWNGARHDLFIYTCLFHESGCELISSEGFIEDITDGNRTRITASTTGVIIPELSFNRSRLSKPKSEFVIHRGLLRMA